MQEMGQGGQEGDYRESHQECVTYSISFTLLKFCEQNPEA